jgi:DMSO/TMAO reductase YedYZ heme-binding membrane subunit
MSRRDQGLLVLVVSAVVAILFVWLGSSWAGRVGEEPIVGSLIWTGRLAFCIFLIPLFASPLRKCIKNDLTAKLMRWRRNAGVAYGGTQVVHLWVIAEMFWTLESPPTEAIMVAVGSLGILLAMGMLITSFEKATRALGQKLWRRLHRAGFHVFMFIYFYDFVIEPVLLGTVGHYWPYATLVLMGMSLRTFVLVRPRLIAPARSA